MGQRRRLRLRRFRAVGVGRHHADGGAAAGGGGRRRLPADAILEALLDFSAAAAAAAKAAAIRWIAPLDCLRLQLGPQGRPCGAARRQGPWRGPCCERQRLQRLSFVWPDVMGGGTAAGVGGI